MKLSSLSLFYSYLIFPPRFNFNNSLPRKPRTNHYRRTSIQNLENAERLRRKRFIYRQVYWKRNTDITVCLFSLKLLSRYGKSGGSGTASIFNRVENLALARRLPSSSTTNRVEEKVRDRLLQNSASAVFPFSFARGQCTSGATNRFTSSCFVYVSIFPLSTSSRRGNSEREIGCSRIRLTSHAFSIGRKKHVHLSKVYTRENRDIYR